MSMFDGLMELESGLSSDIDTDIRKEFAKNPAFFVRKSKEGCARFYSTDKKCFCSTSPVVNIEKYDNGYLKLVTASGHCYNLTVKKTDTELKVVSKVKTSRMINHRDGYDKTIFKFNRPITEEEFISFLKENNYKIYSTDKWWEDYSRVSGEGNTWTYEWVLVYKD